jgi:hypothetical protein
MNWEVTADIILALAAVICLIQLNRKYGLIQGQGA